MGFMSIVNLNLLVAILGQLICCILTVQIGGYETGDCKFPKHGSDQNVDKNALSKIQGLIGKSFRTTDAALPHSGSETFTYDVGICSIPDKYGEDPIYKTAGAIQYVADQSTAPSILGDLSLTEIMAGRDWVSLEYEGGKPYGSHCGGESRRTFLMIICTPGESEGEFRIIEENRNKTSDCFYSFELSHQAVCNSSSSGLSVGSIVVIVFFTLVAVYMIGGALYQRFVVGAKGLEQIPNYHFWQDFGNLQADGCDLLCRCGRRPASQPYRGIGDDQLNNTADEEDYSVNRDDDLLPM